MILRLIAQKQVHKFNLLKDAKDPSRCDYVQDSSEDTDAELAENTRDEVGFLFASDLTIMFLVHNRLFDHNRITNGGKSL